MFLVLDYGSDHLCEAELAVVIRVNYDVKISVTFEDFSFVRRREKSQRLRGIGTQTCHETVLEHNVAALTV